MGRDLRSDIRRRPLQKWVTVLLSGVVTLAPAPVGGSTGPVIAPAAVVAAKSVRSAIAVQRPLLMMPARAALMIPSRRPSRFQPESTGSSAEPVRLDAAIPIGEPADAMAARMQYLPPGTSRLASFAAGAGQVNLDWKHGAKLGASWEFEHTPARPTIELTTSGVRKVYLSVNLHW